MCSREYKCKNSNCRMNGMKVIRRDDQRHSCISCSQGLLPVLVDGAHVPVIDASEAAKHLAEWLDCSDGSRYLVDEKPGPENCDVVEWMESRDSINESFINLIAHAKEINAQTVVSRLMELNRELLDLIHQEKGLGD